MGGCFSKKKTRSSSNNVVTPTDPQFKLESDPQNVMKKEVFVIKHRISHEIDRHSDQGNIPIAGATTSSPSKEEVRLSRSKSTGAQNPNRRYSRSKRSFDFDLNNRMNNANKDYDVLDHHHHHRRKRREERRSSSKERRISISPSRRSESPSPSPSPSLRNLNSTAPAPSTNRPPARMVSVPATHKTNNAAMEQGGIVGCAVKRIHVKRNVSPATRTNLFVYTETRSQEQTQQNSYTQASDQSRKSLVEIDNNATPSNTKITRKLSQDLDTIFDPSPPTYANLLLDDIHNFHQNTTNRPATSPPVFALPECVNKAYSIMEAVADLNSNTRWSNPTAINKDTLNSLSAAIQVQECRKPSSTDPTTQVTQLRGISNGFCGLSKQ